MKIIGIIFFIIAACAYGAFWWLAFQNVKTETLMAFLFMAFMAHSVVGFGIYKGYLND